MKVESAFISHPSSLILDWLGGRDSNPDSQIQSLESYHWTTSQQKNFEFTYHGSPCQQAAQMRSVPPRGSGCCAKPWSDCAGKSTSHPPATAVVLTSFHCARLFLLIQSR